MQITKLHRRIFAATLAALVGLSAASAANAYSVYRKVTSDAATGVVVWTAANFGVSGPQPTLSFFHYADDAAARLAMPDAQCFVKVDIVGVDNPQPGNSSAVGNIGIVFDARAEDQPRPFPWTINFDNVPAGHWSIPRAEITTMAANNPASRVAAAGFQKLATEIGTTVVVINGSRDNCVAAQ